MGCIPPSRSILGSQLPPQYLALSRKDWGPGRLQDGPATGKHLTGVWGRPLAKRNVLASLVEPGPDLWNSGVQMGSVRAQGFKAGRGRAGVAAGLTQQETFLSLIFLEKKPSREMGPS